MIPIKMSDLHFDDEQELLAYAKKIEGLRISDLGAVVRRMDLIHRKHTKGLVAQLVEKEYFGIPTNSSERPDFQDLGIELKVSPLKLVKSTGWYNAKERNVIKVVDYFDVNDNKDWRDSKLIHKLSRVLFVLYVHDKEKPATEWQVVSTFLWSPNKEQDDLIQNDYDIIREKIKAGERNREGDNEFLGTCPKHQGGYNKADPSISKPSAMRDHPVMGRAEKRGFCIKQRSFDQLIADSLGHELLRKGNSVGLPASAYPMLGKQVEYIPSQKNLDDY